MTQAQNILASGFDIGSLDQADVSQITHRVVVVVNADGDDECGFDIVGKNSPEYQAAQQSIRVDGLKRAAKRKTQLDTSTDEGAGAVARTIERNEMSLALSVVKGWFGFKNGGVDATFDKAVVEKLLTRFPTWKDKITSALEVESNFLKR